MILAALGDLDRAFLAFADVDDRVTGLKAEQVRYFFPDILAPLRDDPRFVELLRRIDRAWGLTDAP